MVAENTAATALVCSTGSEVLFGLLQNSYVNITLKYDYDNSNKVMQQFSSIQRKEKLPWPAE